jgi:hypothetical protein
MTWLAGGSPLSAVVRGDGCRCGAGVKGARCPSALVTASGPHIVVPQHPNQAQLVGRARTAAKIKDLVILIQGPITSHLPLFADHGGS